MLGLFPPSLRGSSPSENGSPNPVVKPSRRRDKPQLSCIACRNKKLKCDRQQPCGNCAKRRQPTSCEYLTPGAARDRPKRSAVHRATVPTNVQDRVRHLEELVISLMEGQGTDSRASPVVKESPQPAVSVASSQDSHRHATSDDGSVTQSTEMAHDAPLEAMGRFTTDSNQVNYVGGEHWEAILEDIAELKENFGEGSGVSDGKMPTQAPVEGFDPQILLGSNNHASRAEILSSVPPRPICDRLISRYFNSMDMAPMVIHAPTFLKEYEQFWKSPDTTPLIWIGLLFALLTLAAYFYQLSEDDVRDIPEPFVSLQEMISHYNHRTAQCLVSGNYLKPVRYTLSTLIFHCALELFRSTDGYFGAWILCGTIVRLSLRLGYHRDASHYPGISPYHGEMRRRIWSVIKSVDILTSCQVGLPRMIKDGDSDTAEPNNLLDSDFDENTIELPRARPSTDPTPIAYAIFKNRLGETVGMVVDQTNSTKSLSYETVMHLDSDLLATYATVPAGLAARPLASCITDQPEVILRRQSLETTYEWARCVLHRRYLVPALTNSQYTYSRKSCISAAMRMIQIQSDFYEASQPGAQLFRDRWKISSSLNHGFLLGAMVLCLDLERSSNTRNGTDDEIEILWPRERRLESLNRSYDIWCASSRASAASAKGAEALRIMLRKLKAPNLERQRLGSNAMANWPTPSSSTPESVGLPETTKMQQSLQYSEPLYQDTIDFLEPGTQSSSIPSTSDFISEMIDTQVNFNWGLWDSHFQGYPTSTMPIGAEDFGAFNFQGQDVGEQL